MSNSISAKVKALRGAAVMTQAQFASALGVAQSLVSQCESGRTSPSDLLIRLGNFAAKQRRFADSMWFWKEAGVSVADMGIVATELSAQRFKAMTDKPLPGAPISVPLLRDISYVSTPGIAPQEAIDRWLTLPASIVRNPSTTSCITPSHRFGISIFGEDEDVVALVDASEVEADKLAGKMIAVYESRQREQWPAGVYVGWLHPFDLGKRRLWLIGGIRTPDEIKTMSQLDLHLPMRGIKGVNELVTPMLLAALQGGWMMAIEPNESRIIGRVVNWIASEREQSDQKRSNRVKLGTPKRGTKKP
jgi:DNA-binding XRE family transcriptional regulator